MAHSVSRSTKSTGGRPSMSLSAPSLITFLISFAIVLAVIFERFFGAAIPGLGGDTSQFFVILAAYFSLFIGCLVRSL